jgi:predicted Zn-ribbon and HTH transcriptional regulator
VLFEHAPRFDFRHEAWSLLPSDLRVAVLQETANRTKKLNEKRLATGEHNLLHMDKKPWISSLLTSLAKDGKHPMQKESNIQNLKARNQQDLLDGKHTCQQPGHRERMNKLNNTPTECPHCGKVFKSPGGAGNHIRLKHEKH